MLFVFGIFTFAAQAQEQKMTTAEASAFKQNVNEVSKKIKYLPQNRWLVFRAVELFPFDTSAESTGP